MLIYRVENEKGEGPYSVQCCADCYIGKCILRDKHNGDKNHPTSHPEVLLFTRRFNASVNDVKHGFSSLTSFFDWFVEDGTINTLLDMHSMDVSIYESDKFVDTKRQVVFHKEARLVERRPLLDFALDSFSE